MKESLEEWNIIYIEKQDIRFYKYVAYSGQTAGNFGLKFFVDTQGSVIG